MSQIGFVGLGIMGKPMSKNLLKAGHSVVVYDVVAALARRRWSRPAPRDGASSAADVAAPLGHHHHDAARWPGSGAGGARAGRRARRRAAGDRSSST